MSVLETVSLQRAEMEAFQPSGERWESTGRQGGWDKRKENSQEIQRVQRSGG